MAASQAGAGTCSQGRKKIWEQRIPDSYPLAQLKPTYSKWDDRASVSTPWQGMFDSPPASAPTSPFPWPVLDTTALLLPVQPGQLHVDGNKDRNTQEWWFQGNKCILLEHGSPTLSKLSEQWKNYNIRASLSFDQALCMVNIRAKETVDK